MACLADQIHYFRLIGTPQLLDACLHRVAQAIGVHDRQLEVSGHVFMQLKVTVDQLGQALVGCQSAILDAVHLGQQGLIQLHQQFVKQRLLAFHMVIDRPRAYADMGGEFTHADLVETALLE